MNIRAIHIRLIIWYSGLIIAVSLVFAFYIYQDMERRLYADMGQTLERRAHEIADNVLSRIPPEPAKAIAAQIEAVYTPEAISRFIRIRAQDNSILYLSGLPKNGQFDPKSIPLDLKDGKSIIPVGQHLLQMFVLTAETHGNHYRIDMGAPTNQEETALHNLILTLLYGLPVIIVMVSGGGYLLVRHSLQPVERLRATAESITFGNLRNRLPVAITGDAIEDLSVTLNQMLDRLENSYEQANRFSADASHELRTPLSIMRIELESLIQRPSLPVAEREIIGIILEETERMSHIAENLFTMSHLDAGDARIRDELVDLAQLVENTAEQMRLLAEEKAIRLTVGVHKAVVAGDADRLKQIIVNLLDNAIKYTPEGGTVSLHLETSQHQAILTLKDTGIGIAAEALPHVFERFFRADKVRSRALGGGGLGLSIVQTIVQAHGGTVDMESTEGKGAICHVTIPLANGKESKA